MNGIFARGLAKVRFLNSREPLSKNFIREQTKYMYKYLDGTNKTNGWWARWCRGRHAPLSTHTLLTWRSRAGSARNISWRLVSEEFFVALGILRMIKLFEWDLGAQNLASACVFYKYFTPFLLEFVFWFFTLETSTLWFRGLCPERIKKSQYYKASGRWPNTSLKYYPSELIQTCIIKTVYRRRIHPFFWNHHCYLSKVINLQKSSTYCRTKYI